MTSLIPYVASIAGATCYGFASILEQIGAKKEDSLKTINPLHLISLFKQGSYFLGILLDIIGWLFFLVAVRSLPLFLVQSFIALSILVSALLDRYWLKHPIKTIEKFAITSVVIGVSILSIVAKPGSAALTTDLVKWLIVISPLIIAIIGVIVLRLKNNSFNSAIVALMAGLAFGGTSVVTRIIVFSDIDKVLVQGLLAISLIIYGVLAIMFLSIALQREKVNRVNSVVLASEVIAPSLIGILILGDSVRNGLWLVMFIGLAFVSFGALLTSSSKSK